MTAGAYTERDVPAPQDAYGISKREAEDLLMRVTAETGLEAVILRLPLVYGPGLCKIAGKSEELEKLTGTLFVDSSKIRNLLGWRPPFTMEEGIRETIRVLRK
ncbi:MAG: NAD-dependent epimerase/dehydratase family protein [Candidatus Omnitrophica bacterium]|nr:NAD-dependent epimerase/dehydratase family protein [Candidatus Omnitrophota bacterium]